MNNNFIAKQFDIILKKYESHIILNLNEYSLVNNIVLLHLVIKLCYSA